MKFVGSDVLITEEGWIRVMLALDQAEIVPGWSLGWFEGSWATVFAEAAPPVAHDELLDTYVAHGAETARLWIDLKPGVSKEAVLYALDWLKVTATQVSQRYAGLEAQAAYLREVARQWLDQEVRDR